MLGLKVGGTIAVGAAVFAQPIGFLIAIVVGVVVAFASRPVLHARAVRRLQPMLATTVGELPGPVHDHERFPSAPAPTPGAYGP